MIEANPFYQVLHGRHSTRRFQKREVPRAVLKNVLEAALRAPSAHNSQPWRFVVLPRDEKLELLAKRMGQQLAHDLTKDGLESGEIKSRVKKAGERILSAPVMVLLCLDQESGEKYQDERRSQAEYIMAVQGVAMAGGNILLAAHAEGLGACWLCAPLFVPDLIREFLSLPEGWQPQAMILLGYPADPKSPSDRRPLEEVSIWR
jgi:F420 biosynthesis protein FbiB-like protein